MNKKYLLIAILFCLGFSTLPTSTTHSEAVYWNYASMSKPPIDTLQKTSNASHLQPPKNQKIKKTKNKKSYAATWLMWGNVSLLGSIIFLGFIAYFVLSLMGVVQAIRHHKVYDYKQNKRTSIWLIPFLLIMTFFSGFIISVAFLEGIMLLAILALPTLVFAGLAIAAFVLVLSQLFKQEKTWLKENQAAQ